MVQRSEQPLSPVSGYRPGRTGPGDGTTLIDLLDRILDKGVVIAGDIAISIVDIEFLSIKLRLLVASVDKAVEMGIDWWKHDPYFSSLAPPQDATAAASRAQRRMATAPEDAVLLPAAAPDGADLAALHEELRAMKRQQDDLVRTLTSQMEAFMREQRAPPGAADDAA